MQRFFIPAVLLLVIVVAYAGPSGNLPELQQPKRVRVHIVQAPPPLTQAQVDAQADSAMRWKAFMWTLTLGAAIMFVVAPLGAVLRYWIIPSLNAWGEHNVGENGLPKPKTINAAPFHERINPFREGKYLTLDPAKMTDGVVGSRLNGSLKSETGMGNVVSAADQVHLAERTLQAATLAYSAGRQARAHRGGKMGRYEAEMISGVSKQKEREAAAKAEKAELSLQMAQQRALPAPVDEVEQVVHAPTVDEAIATSKPTGFVVGYTDDGLICKINLQASIHCAIIGSTGTGKTASIGMKMIVDCLRHGYHTIILDGMGGDDLGVFADHAEWYDSTPASFAQQLAALAGEHESRLTRCGGDRQAKKALRPIAVFIEEFNEIWSKMEPEQVEYALPLLETLIAKARHTRIHLIFIGQESEEWPKTIFNIKAKIVFQTGVREAQRLGEWHAQHLPDNGEFLYKMQRYKAWLWEDAYRRFLPAGGGSRGRRLLETERKLVSFSETRKPPGNHRKPTGNRPETDRKLGGFSEVEGVFAPISETETGGGVYAPKNTEKVHPPAVSVSSVSEFHEIPVPIQRVWDRFMDLDTLGKKFFEVFPNGTQIELRKIMSALDGNHVNSYKKRAFTIYHSYSPNGKNNSNA